MKVWAIVDRKTGNINHITMSRSEARLSREFNEKVVGAEVTLLKSSKKEESTKYYYCSLGPKYYKTNKKGTFFWHSDTKRWESSAFKANDPDLDNTTYIHQVGIADIKVAGIPLKGSQYPTKEITPCYRNVD